VSGSGISWAYASLHPRCRQITTPAPPPLSFLEAGCPSCRPTNSVKAHRYDTVKTVKSRTLLTRQNCSESSKALTTYQLIDEVLVWLSVCSEVQIVCMWSSWCHCLITVITHCIWTVQSQLVAINIEQLTLSDPRIVYLFSYLFIYFWFFVETSTHCRVFQLVIHQCLVEPHVLCCKNYFPGFLSSQ